LLLLVSLAHLFFRRGLAVAALRLRPREFKELEIVVLRDELAVLRRQVARPRLEDTDPLFLAAASRILRETGRPSFFVRPETLQGWHRRLVRRQLTYAGRGSGRPAISEQSRELVLQLAGENPRWRYQRIVGELAGVDFIELASRRVHLAGCTENPSGTWTAQQARELAWSLSERLTPIRFLIHDRDNKFSKVFDEVFGRENVEIIRTPFRAPKANAFAERWVGTVRRDCPRLDPDRCSFAPCQRWRTNRF
jgi:putative transposase